MEGFRSQDTCAHLSDDMGYVGAKGSKQNEKLKEISR